MATKRIVLTEEWQKITTGAETALLQCRNSLFELYEGSERPDSEFPGHLFSVVMVTPPSVVWVRALNTSDTHLYVSPS